MGNCFTSKNKELGSKGSPLTYSPGIIHSPPIVTSPLPVVHEESTALDENKIREFLRSDSWGDLPRYSMNGIRSLARVIALYDGDTWYIVVPSPGHELDEAPRKYLFRLAGLDCPEMRPRLIIPDRDLHVKAAKAVTRLLSVKYKDAIVWIEFKQEEKYGRLLGTIYPDQDRDESINDWMISHQLALPYAGKTKPEWTRSSLNKVLSNCAALSTESSPFIET